MKRRGFLGAIAAALSGALALRASAAPARAVLTPLHERWAEEAFAHNPASPVKIYAADEPWREFVEWETEELVPVGPVVRHTGWTQISTKCEAFPDGNVADRIYNLEPRDVTEIIHLL